MAPKKKSLMVTKGKQKKGLEQHLKEHLLKKCYRIAPFPLVGDGWFGSEQKKDILISCVINFYGRLDLLNGILNSLASQEYPKNHFEIILIEDQGGTEKGKSFCESFDNEMNIIYKPLDKNFGKMGYSRNFGLAQATGKYVLFLDDDTIILQNDFLDKLGKAFTKDPEADALLPRGRSSYTLWPEKYAFHDPYFPTSRCTAYRLAVLKELGGFMSSFVGQEDVEFVVRFTLTNKTAKHLSQIEYFHPPLLIPDLKKPKAVGISFAGLRGRYSTFFLLLVAFNCSRHIPLLLSPKRHHREMGRFGLGFILGFIKAWLKPDTQGIYG